ncbi:MAG: hypothetical protein WBH31_14840 [Promethearchaeia archaeon]
MVYAFLLLLYLGLLFLEYYSAEGEYNTEHYYGIFTTDGSAYLSLLFFPLFTSLGIMINFGAIRAFSKNRFARTVRVGVTGTIFLTVVIILHIMNVTSLPSVVIYPGFYLIFVPFISLWVLNIYIGAKFIKYGACDRCGKFFITDQLVECHQCRRKVCPNCLDTEFNVCTACKTNYVMRMKMVEKQKAQQAQSQQVVIQQVPQTQISQTPTGMKHCIHCGKLIKSIAQFCEACGKEQ